MKLIPICTPSCWIIWTGKKSSRSSGKNASFMKTTLENITSIFTGTGYHYLRNKENKESLKKVKNSFKFTTINREREYTNTQCRVLLIHRRGWQKLISLWLWRSKVLGSYWYENYQRNLEEWVETWCLYVIISIIFLIQSFQVSLNQEAIGVKMTVQ